MPAFPRPLIAANWKSNQHWDGCVEFIAQLQERQPELFELDQEQSVDVLICPPFPYLALLGSLLEDAAVFLGGQDVSRFAGGAYTGDVSAGMLADLECDYCIVGHSERRNVFGDDDRTVAQKLEQLRAAALTPVLCIGEPLKVRDAGSARDFTLSQLSALREQLKRFEPDQLAIAYEPVWAIGTGRNAQPADVQEMCAAIRDWLAEALGDEYARQSPLLYGGSVKPENASEYFVQEDINGALVGGASLEAASFAKLIELYHELVG
jgi:triosephosphate isomerase